MTKRTMPRSSNEPPWRYMTGKVANVEVAGKGENSAFVGFRLEGDDGEARYFVTGAAPGYEGEVFTATASLLVAAYVGGHAVSVRYLEVEGEMYVTQAVRLGAPRLSDGSGSS